LIDIYLVTGFLGAGKTTLMKNLIKFFSDSKVALIVNDFASEGVDGAVLEKEGFVTKEIVDGSIFCVCKSDRFIDAILEMKSLDVDYLFVESSGLADPFGMFEIMTIVDKLAPEKYHYSGSICVVDAVNFKKIYQTANVIKNQIEGADLIIINKTDLSTEDEINKLSIDLKKLNDFAPITKTSYAKINSKELIYSLKWHNPKRKGYIISRTAGIIKFVLSFDSEPIDKLQKWLKTWSHLVYRAKGFCFYNDAQYYVQAVGNNVEISKLKVNKDFNYIIVLSPAKDQIKKDIQTSWMNTFSTNLKINS
jgi:G3E family GTPase